MKKSLFSTLALFGMFGVGAITSHAEDTAEAVTNISANVISGGITLETVDSIDFGQIPIGESAERKQVVYVTNLTGGLIDTSVKLNEDLPNGVTLASRIESGMSPNLGTDPVDFRDLSYSDGPFTGGFPINWVLEASSSAQLDSNLSRTLMFTASPRV